MNQTADLMIPLVIMSKNYKNYNSNLMAANEVCMTSG